MTLINKPRDTTHYDFRPMQEYEVDAEMAAYFHELKKIAATEKTSANDERLKPTQPEHDTTSELSPEMRHVKKIMLAAISRPSSSVPQALERRDEAKKSSESSKAFIDACRGITILPLPIKALETPAAVELIICEKRPAVSALAELANFPVNDVLTIKQFDDPLGEMTELCRVLLLHNDYAKVRNDYCNLSIQLNMIGKLAPAFRPILKSGSAWGNSIHNVIHRDQLVIDLHWCYVTKMPVMPLDQDHVALFGNDAVFQFDRAWLLAGKKWKSEYRTVQVLCLTTFQQCQMLKLRGPEVAARIKAANAGWKESRGKSASKVAKLTCQISQWAERNKRIRCKRDFYVKLWLARESLGGDASMQQIAELHALMMGGNVQDRTTIRDKLKSLDKHVRVD